MDRAWFSIAGVPPCGLPSVPMVRVHGPCVPAPFFLGVYANSERIIFCFVVVYSCVYNHLILEWIIAHYFLFLCSISFRMYLFDNFSSSSADVFDSTRLKSISSALALRVSRGRHAKLIVNFSHESDVTFLRTPL